MKKILLLLLFSLVAIPSAMSQIEEIGENYKPKIDFHNLIDETHAASLPVEVLDWSSCKDITLMDREIKSISFVLKNRSAEPVKILRTMSSCPCLTLIEPPPQDFVLEAGKSLTVNMTINGGKLPQNDGEDFTRTIQFYFESASLGKITAVMPVNGTIKLMWNYEPACFMNMGEFHGLTGWSRTFKITSLFDDPAIKLLPPAKSDKYEFTMKQLSEKVFELTVTPRNNPTSTFKSIFNIPVVGLENYGPIQVGFKAAFRKLPLTLERNKIVAARPKDDAPLRVSTKIIYANNRESIIALGGRAIKNHSHGETAKFTEPLAADENKAMPMDKKSTWEILFKDIEIQTPEHVAVETATVDDGIEVTFIIQPDFYKYKALLSTTLTKGEQKLAKFNCFFK